MNLLSELNYLCEKYGEKTALIDHALPNGSISFCEVMHIVECWIGFFKEKKITSKRILIYGDAGAFWLLTFLGIVCSGNVAVLACKTEEQIEMQSFEKLDISYCLYGVERCGFCGCEEDSYFDINHVFLEGHSNSYKYIVGEINGNRAAVIALSSGTTGQPKAVELTHSNIVSDILYGSEIFGDTFSNKDRVVSVLPITHLFGLTVGILIPMHYGAEVIFENENSSVLKAILKGRPTVLIAVPAIIEGIKKYIESQSEKKTNNSEDFNVHTIVSGSAPLGAEVERFFIKNNISIFSGYGATECSPIISCNCHVANKSGSVGRVNHSKYCKIEIEDEEIIVSGDIVAKRYAFPSKEIGNKFNTGDLGYIDDDGFLFIIGRKNRVFVLPSGYKINPEVVEEQIKAKIKEIRDIEIFYKTKNNTGLLIAVVCTSENLQITEGEIKLLINSKLPNYMWVNEVILKKNFRYTTLHKRKKTSEES